MAIGRFGRGDGGHIFLTNGIKVPVSFRKRDELPGMFEKMKK